MAAATASESAKQDQLKVVFSRQVLAAGDVAISKAEHIARASSEYTDWCEMLDTARTAAEKARAEVEWLKCRWETWRSKSSLAKARLANG